MDDKVKLNQETLKLNQEKLHTPMQVLKVTEDYMDDCNEVKKFIDEHYDITDNENDRLSSTDLFRHFKSVTGSKMDTKSFSYNMEEMNIQKKRCVVILKDVN